MSAAGQPKPLRFPAPPAWDTPGWTVWLADRIDPAWRPGEWDARHWLFTGDLESPRTSSSTCRARRCDQVVISGNVFCTLCAEHLRASSQDPDTFATTFTPARERSARGMVIAQCSIVRDGVRCVRPRHCNDKCATHYNAWKYHAVKGTEQAWLRDRAQPFTETIPCLVPTCPSPAYNSRGLCNYHARQWSQDNRTKRTDVHKWAPQQPPYLDTHQFSLLTLNDLLRHERAVREVMSVSGCGWGRAAGGGFVGYCFLAKLPVSASMRMPSLTRRFSLARVPSMFFGSSWWSRAWQTFLARSGPVASLKTARMRG